MGELCLLPWEKQILRKEILDQRAAKARSARQTDDPMGKR